MELSVLIPARSEMFLARTIQDVLEHAEADTEIIAVLDGAWADPPIPDHPRVTLIHHAESIGQRAAVNEAARLSNAKYIMKLDAHCALDQGFDVKLMADMQPDWTVVPRLYNLHAFNWVCVKCGHETYQGPIPPPCPVCGGVHIEQVMVWTPRWNRRSDFMRFDSELKFQYWHAFGKRPEAKADIAETMSLLGACFFMERARYWELEGLDEAFGSWGTMGSEIALKSWLSGGKLMVNKKTFYSHMFRTQGGSFGFPYPLSQRQVDAAQTYAQKLFYNNAWPGQVRPLSWLLDHFAPVPDWHEENGKERLEQVQQAGREFSQISTTPRKGIIYYTDNRLSPPILAACQQQIRQSVNGHEIISVSLQPLDFGRNITLDKERGYLTMFEEILAGLEASTADIIFLAEHDILYHQSHFAFTPPDPAKVYYNTNVWHIRASDGHAVTYTAKRTSQLCAYRAVLLTHYRKRVELVRRHGFSRRQGFEPGSHRRAERVDDLESETWHSKFPNLDLKHGQNLTEARWNPAEFRDQRNCRNWQESDVIPGWGSITQILELFGVTDG